MTQTPQDTTAGTAEGSPPAGGPTKKRGGGLSTMLLADLKSLAGGLGVAGAGTMKKAQLVDAIRAAQSGGQSGAQSGGQAEGRSGGQAEGRSGGRTPKRGAERPADRAPEPVAEQAPEAAPEAAREPVRRDEAPRDTPKDTTREAQSGREEQPPRSGDQGSRNQAGGQSAKAQGQGNQGTQGTQGNQPANQGSDDADGDGDGEGGTRRNRRRRGRDRTRTAGATGATGQTAQGGQPGGQSSQGAGPSGHQPGQQPGHQPGRNEPDTTILDDDVLVPAAGILDVLDNYAFVRTSGYLPGVDDVYLSLSMVRKFGLRRGDALTGQVRQPREGERKEKFNPMVRIDSVNGSDPETARNRPEFADLTPVHPDQRLRLETAPDDLVGRVLDLAAPLGKGQRALLVSASRSGKTSVLRSVAASVTRNNPECHLMVVLVDERPEEVTDFQRSVKGEVVASTFDRPPADHTVVAELAIERAKRLVELGHDVVVLIDGLTRLARAYNLAAPGGGGRTPAGALDANAIFPPKRFFGAARNLEDGGSLTILATATVESGTPLDEIVLDELTDSANCEVRLSRELTEKGVFPPVDLVRSGTRAVDRLVSREELAILDKLRRILAGMDGTAAAELLLERVRGSQTNVELLTKVQRAAPNVV